MLRSALVVIVALLVTAFFSFSVVIFSFLTAAGTISRRIARLWAKVLLFISGIETEVIGADNVLRDRPQIFMANHQSNFDILIFLALMPVDFLWIAKKELFRVPLFGRAMKKAGYIGIDRQDHEKALKSVDEAAEKLHQGLSIASFPEGRRSRDGALLPFKQGMFHLAIGTGVSIVPVSIIGSGKIMAKKSLRVNRGKIIMVINKPVEVSGHTKETRTALMEEVRQSMAAGLTGQHDEEGDSGSVGGQR